MGTLHGDLGTFMKVSHRIILEWNCLRHSL